MNVLYIGGTGEISFACVAGGAALGQHITVYNRGYCTEPLPAGVTQIVGDLADERAYRALGETRWDVVCQFKAYEVADVQRDVDVFGGRVGQYLFISSASVYAKPPTRYVITEQTPACNPFWDYSQKKIACEDLLMAAHAQGRMPVTIVRPSHTYRRGFPGTIIGGDDIAWRLLHGRPIIVHGDGTALWTLTHATDFAWSFVRLLGRGMGEVYQITNHLQGCTWDQIVHACAAGLGVEAKIVHVPTDTLVRLKPAYTGPLLGDKTWPSLFDCSKVRALVGAHEPTVGLEEGMKMAARFVRERMKGFRADAELHAWFDRLAAAQEGIASGRSAAPPTVA